MSSTPAGGKPVRTPVKASGGAASGKLPGVRARHQFLQAHQRPSRAQILAALDRAGVFAQAIANIKRRCHL